MRMDFDRTAMKPITDLWRFWQMLFQVSVSYSTVLLFWSSPHWCSVHAGYSHTSSRPSRHLLQFTVPVWPTPLHSLSVLKGMTPHSHTITCCLSHTLTLSSCLSKSFSHRYIHITSPLPFLHSLFLTATGVMLPYILRQLINKTLAALQPTCSVKAPQVSNFISTLPASDVWLLRAMQKSGWGSGFVKKSLEKSKL